MEKNPTQKSLKIKKKLVARAALTSNYYFLGGIAPKLEVGIL
jgi:hypothetical protein